jgi:predicted Zn finger-like uncharacterized protein
MKFTCERCDAQYMISDEKVGPNGVKVRCKKCSNVIVVRRAVENGAVAAEAPAKPAPGGTGEHALERELGQAFDQAFGDPPAAAPAPAPDLDATQAAAPEDAARVAAAAPPATEWYVAIGQAQVGPLPIAEVKRKWEAGDVGPDSLVWRPGMGDWSPLSSMPDLAAFLAPVPHASARAAPRGDAAPVAPRAEPAQAPAAVTPTPAAEVSWKPVGASALAALASEELAARDRPEPRAEPARAAAGVRSLVEELPDGGGVDPTGVLPLPMKALEKTDEKKIERRSSVARGAEELRHKRSAARAVIFGAVAVVAVVAAGAYFVVRASTQNAAVVATAAPAPVPAPVAAAPVAAPAPAADPAPAAVTAPAAAPDAAPSAPAATEPPKVAAAEPAAPKPEPAPAAKPAAKAPPAVAQREPPRQREAPLPRKEKEPVRVAQATPTAAVAPPPAATAPAPRPKKDSVLDFEGGNDAALDEALGGGGRKVYVPPAPGGNTALPQRLPDSQVNETILARVSALQGCVQEQKARDPSATGVVKMRWSISPEGAVQSVACATPEYAGSPIAQCLTGVLRAMKFPRSQTGRPDVTFPIKF